MFVSLVSVLSLFLSTFSVGLSFGTSELSPLPSLLSVDWSVFLSVPSTSEPLGLSPSAGFPSAAPSAGFSVENPSPL